jgi:hypothetical protein
VIAHSVSVMVIQAGGARMVMDSEPERAEASLRSVERAGREALAEMRRLLGVLDGEQDPRALAPQPGLADLDLLLSRTRASGLATDLLVDGEPAGGVARARSVRIPDRPGGADERDQARRPGKRARCASAGKRTRSSSRSQTTAAAWAHRRRLGRARDRRHARARSAARREHPRRRQAPAAASPSEPASRSLGSSWHERLRQRLAASRSARVDAIFAVVMIIELELEAWLSRTDPGPRTGSSPPSRRCSSPRRSPSAGDSPESRVAVLRFSRGDPDAARRRAPAELPGRRRSCRCSLGYSAGAPGSTPAAASSHCCSRCAARGSRAAAG